MFIRCREWMSRYKMLFLMIFMAFLFLSSLTAYAADAKVLSTDVYDDSIYVYIRGISEVQPDSVVQIGNVICPGEQISSAHLGDSGLFMRTLILVDNSFSISDARHADIQAIMEGLVSCAMENEQIRIGTFADQVNYLCDFTSDKEVLNNAISEITYNNQDTYLSDVLYDVITELKSEKFDTYTRMLIIADGADENPNGLTSSEVRNYIGENAYPVYTVGIPGKNNASELEVLFSFSRASGSEYFLLDGSVSNEDIVTTLAQDQISLCLKISPDESLKDGSNKSILLKLNTPEGGIELKTSTDMPFGNGITQQPEIEDDSQGDKEDEEKENRLTELTPEKNRENQEKDNKVPWFFIIIAVIVLLAAITVIVFVVVKRKKNAQIKQDETLEILPQSEDFDNNQTGLLREDMSGNDIGNTTPLWNGSNIYLILTRLDTQKTVYKKPITNVLRIGRWKDQDIVIDDDKLSKRHCEIRLRGDLLYIKDCNSTNGTKYDGMAVYDNECPMISGGKIKIGSYSYQVDLVRE